ncbi:MAG: ABC transporter ATP-binding protein [Pseudomonadota bacterium]
MKPLTAPLHIANVSKTYDGRRVLDNVSLTLKPGTVTALVGASGAGKTTFMRLIAGMEHVDTGTIHSGELLMSSARTHLPTEQRHIGLIFQDFALFPHLTVQGNIEFGLGHLPKETRGKIALDWIRRLGLTDRIKAFPHHLSGGEQQRVAIARAMAPEPRALLMDEPFSGLDPERRESTRLETLSIVRNAGIPALLVTHEPVEALANADQIAVMQAGEILQTGSPDALYRSPISLSVAKALGRVQSLRRVNLPEPLLALVPNTQTVYLRPEALQIAADGVPMTVRAARRRGTLCEIEFKLGQDRVIAVSILPELPAVGDEIGIRLDPAYILPFDPDTF